MWATLRGSGRSVGLAMVWTLLQWLPAVGGRVVLAGRLPTRNTRDGDTAR